MQPLPYSADCFVCGHENVRGLKLRFFLDGEWVVSRCVLPPEYRGFLDRTHGGIVSALLDETMGWACVLRCDRFTYTVELKVRFCRPVDVEQPLDVRARVTRHTRRLTFAEAEIRNGSDTVLAKAEGKFMAIGEDETREIAEMMIYDHGAWRFGKGVQSP